MGHADEQARLRATVVEVPSVGAADPGAAGIFCLLGMHRSGTSLLAGLLHASGVVMGSERVFRPRASPQNPEGFFENIQFRRLNDRILGRCGYSVKGWNPVMGTIEASRLQRLQMRRLLARWSHHAQWGWKDPRQCLTATAWLPVLTRPGVVERLRVIVVYRDPLAVARSLMVRENVATVSHGLALWYLYNREILRFIEALQAPVAAVSFERLVVSPHETLGPLAAGLGVPLEPATVDAFVRPELDRSGGGPQPRSSIGDDLVVEVQARLRRLEESPRLGRLS